VASLSLCKRITRAIYVSRLMVRLMARISAANEKTDSLSNWLNNRGGGGKNQISASRRVPLAVGEHTNAVLCDRGRVCLVVQRRPSRKLRTYVAPSKRFAIRGWRYLMAAPALLIESPDCLIFAGKLQTAVLRLARRACYAIADACVWRSSADRAGSCARTLLLQSDSRREGRASYSPLGSTDMFAYALT